MALDLRDTVYFSGLWNSWTGVISQLMKLIN